MMTVNLRDVPEPTFAVSAPSLDSLPVPSFAASEQFPHPTTQEDERNGKEGDIALLPDVAQRRRFHWKDNICIVSPGLKQPIGIAVLRGDVSGFRHVDTGAPPPPIVPLLLPRFPGQPAGGSNQSEKLLGICPSPSLRRQLLNQKLNMVFRRGDFAVYKLKPNVTQDLRELPNVSQPEYNRILDMEGESTVPSGEKLVLFWVRLQSIIWLIRM
ncbi:uncharacterized protein LOC132209377 [Stegostoma tigrinum]|uniref:uncharacterized protein LOC132208606 n=1 Tax=Stegostoma tigrinum TaxID=3053191 RepID=UPI00286FC28F|nr:uncharacterized protein LOC132208606 [Stegostoma tigrinum]XP_059500467.1 uncharacterized protein LOC132209377 [Stegostoma tigrinum]